MYRTSCRSPHMRLHMRPVKYRRVVPDIVTKGDHLFFFCELGLLVMTLAAEITSSNTLLLLQENLSKIFFFECLLQAQTRLIPLTQTLCTSQLIFRENHFLIFSLENL